MNFYTNFFVSGNKYYLRYIKDGRRKHKVVSPSVSLYQKTSHDTEFKNLRGDSLEEIEFDSIIFARSHVKNCRESGRELWGFPRFEYALTDTIFPGIDGIEYNFSDIRIVYLDIECESENGFPNVDEANEVINAITLGFQDKYYTFGLEDVDEDSLDEDCYYKKFSSEKAMLRAFIAMWRKIDPDIVTHWNGDLFDIPYLVNRISSLYGMGMANLLSPWKEVELYETYKMGNTQSIYKIKGIASLDYLDLYKKYTPSVQESYKLDYIAHVELGEKKLDYSEYDNLHTLYKENYTKYIQYNIQDVKLLRRLEDKKRFIELACRIAYMAKVNYEDIFMNVRLWDVIIANYLKHERNVMVPAVTQHESGYGYEGAFVKDTKPGMYDWLVSFDLTSLYPSLIIQYNISPETIIRGSSLLSADDILNETPTYKEEIQQAIDNNATLAANGAMFSKDQVGFLPELMDKYFKDRSSAKKKKLEYETKLQDESDKGKREKYQSLANQYDSEQWARKILLNSAYGALGSNYFRYYDVNQATAITLSGQLAIKVADKTLNMYLRGILKDDKDRSITGDTDSIYLDVSDLVNKFCKSTETNDIVNFIDKACKEKIHGVIDAGYDKMFKDTNALTNAMDMKREVIASGFFTQKKRYALKVYDDEGVRLTNPKIKITGLEAVRSTTPQLCREKMKELIGLIFDTDNDTILKFMSDFEDEFMQMSLYDIAIPTGVKNVSQYMTTSGFMKGTPMHVKGSIVYNRFVIENGLDDKYELIGDDDKVKQLLLVKENPFGSNVFCFPAKIPDEADIDKYVDRVGLYEKSFYKAIKRMLDAIGWRSDHNVSLRGFLNS